MKASVEYIIYVAFLHLSLGVVIYLWIGKGLWLLLAEALLLLSAYLALRLYRSLVSPLKLLSRGVGALADQDFSVKMAPTGSKEMDQLGLVYNRMIDQLRGERVTGRQREEFLDQLVNAAGVGILIFDFDGRVQRTNPWIRELEKQLPDLHNTVIEPSRRMESGGNHIFVTSDNRRLRTEYSTFIDRGFERGFLIIQDVTTDLLTAEKEAYGKVIRMMAHEVNNSNAAIVSVLRTILEAAHAGDDDLGELSRDFLPTVINRAENMSTFMRNFARVVRLPQPNLRRTQLNELAKRGSDLMLAVLRENQIELSYDLSDHPTVLLADTAQIEQVIVNAITNARESIGSGGRVVVATATDPLQLIIADNGPGISPADAGNIFTPFFSTKPTGQGVGLTLTREILEAHKAHYHLRTEADGWTRLRIFFA